MKAFGQQIPWCNCYRKRWPIPPKTAANDRGHRVTAVEHQSRSVRPLGLHSHSIFMRHRQPKITKHFARLSRALHARLHRYIPPLDTFVVPSRVPILQILGSQQFSLNSSVARQQNPVSLGIFAPPKSCLGPVPIPFHAAQARKDRIS